MSSSLIRQLQRAERLLGSGDAAGAQLLCQQILAKTPRNPDAFFMLGIAQLAQGRAADAVPLFARVLAIDPRHGAALENLGLGYLMLGRFQDAEQALGRASAITGAPASVFMRLGIAILEQGRAEDALTSLNRALALEPDNADCHLNLGRAFAAIGDLPRAADCFHGAIRLAPQRPEGLYNLGAIALQHDDLTQARQWFERALAHSPEYVDARLNLGIVLRQQSELEAAAEHLHRAHALEPLNPAVSTELARTLALLGRLELAHEQYSKALAADPGFAAAHEGLASVCITLGRTREAIAHLNATLATEPDNVAALTALAGVLFQDGDLDAARAVAERTLRLDASNASGYVTLANIHLVRSELASAIDRLKEGYEKTRSGVLLGTLAYQLRQACDWPAWRAAWDEIVPRLETDNALGSPFWLLCEPTSTAQQLAYTKRWAAARFAHMGPLRQAPARPVEDSRRLRVGYLSSDLHDHATAYLMAEVFEHHDRDRFEVFAYSYGPEDHSAMRQRIRTACEHFIDIARESDDQAVRRIQADTLDILVDLKGYTVGDRLTILAHRPCAIQATWLGYPGTTGARFIDYMIADPVVVPEAAEVHYSERIVRLPRCYQPNDRARAVADPLTRQEYGLPAEAFVFCCFNQTYKITPEVFAVWMRVLLQVPDSVLWLLEGNALATHNLCETARTHGVDASRLVFAPRLPNRRHLARYRVADVALDTFPYTSHTTMSDAIWCGCPGIGLCGETFASRVSASILIAADIPELVTHSLEEYERLAVQLACSPDRLRELRACVAHARDGSALFDSLKLTRDLEALYVELGRKSRSS